MVSDSPPSILLVTKGLDIGGVERTVVDLAIGLSRRGIPVEVALVNPRRDRLAANVEGADITLHRLGGSDLIGVRAARHLARLVNDPRFDVVHVHGPLPAVLARVTARSKRVVTTSHTPWGSLRRSTRVLWRLTAWRDAAVVAVSGAVASSLPRSARARAVVLPHGIDQAKVKAALHHVRPGASAEHTVTVMTVASHRDAKNYPNLLDGVRAALDAGACLRLIAIGEGPNLAVHQQLANTLGLGDAVTFEPPSDDVLTRIAGADLLVVASDYEGQPIVVAEALALGLPVVATAVGRVPEMVSPAVGRVVPPRDPRALGAALAELAGDPELRSAMGTAAAAQVLSWTLDDVLDAHVALYREVAAG